MTKAEAKAVEQRMQQAHDRVAGLIPALLSVIPEGDRESARSMIADIAEPIAEVRAMACAELY